MKQFEVVGFTTSFDEWFRIQMSKEATYLKMDRDCIQFAMKQTGFMTELKAEIGTEEYRVVYEAKTRATDSLNGVVIDGPLYAVSYIEVADTTAEKTVYQQYLDPDTFEVKEGYWYPKKTMYKVRYGFLEK